MFETILSILCLLLALLGLAWLIRLAAMRLMVPKDSGRRALMVLLDEETAEFELRAALESARWAERCCPVILAVDCGLKGHTREICRKLCAAYENVLLLPAAALPEFCDRAPWLQRK